MLAAPSLQRYAPYLLVKPLQSKLSVTEIAAKTNFMIEKVHFRRMI